MGNEETTALLQATQGTIDGLPEILRERAKILSEVPCVEEKGERISIFSFELGEELYGVELSYLIETRQSVPFRQLPCAPSYLVGIANIRGELVPVVDLCPILGLRAQELHKVLPCLLVLSLNGNKLALVVARARDIVTFLARELKPPPLSLQADRALFIKGEYLLENRLVSVLDMEKLQAPPTVST